MSPIALPVRRSRLVNFGTAEGVVVEIDATEVPEALAVLQASLHDLPEGQRLGYGYDLATAGLGAWVGDQKVRLRVWPALVDEDGTVTADDPSVEGADVLVVDFDPVADRQALLDLARVGRLLIAGPEAGPVPLILAVEPELVAEVLAEVGITD